MKAVNKASWMVGVFALMLCGKATAGPLEDGMVAFERGDYTTSAALLKPLAEQGNGEAQQGIGLVYDLGYGVPQSFSTAITWYRRAAQGGSAAGQFRLAFMYDFGLGIEKDQAQAAELYRKAAEQGLAAAEGRLARLYLDGLGLGQDYQEAWNWGDRAYAHGNLDAAALLCEMQGTRTVPPKAPRQTEKWCAPQKAIFADFWAGTEPVPSALTADQLVRIVGEIERPGFVSRPINPLQSRSYAAVTMRRPKSIDLPTSFDRYFALMSAGGSARVAVRGVYLSRSLSNELGPGVHIVAEKDLPVIADGGCSVIHVKYDDTRHVALDPRCGGR